MTEIFLGIVALPLTWLVFVKFRWPEQLSGKAFALLVAACLTVPGLTLFIGKQSGMMDFEILNGKITERTSEQFQCPTGWVRERSSQCTAFESREVEEGSPPQKITEYRYKYAWEKNWLIKTDVSKDPLRVDRSDEQGVTEPRAWLEARVGAPASRESSYRNYVKAAKSSLFHRGESAMKKYAKQIPDYPRVRELYKVDRVVTVGHDLSEATRAQLNESLGGMLADLGHAKQVNVVVVLTSVGDRDYRNAVEAAWLSGKKNDVVVFAGLQGEKIVWADAMTWALGKGNELLQVNLRDGIEKMGTFEPKAFASLIRTQVSDHFKRPEMKSFEYLEAEIGPSGLSIGLAFLFAVLIGIGGTLPAIRGRKI